MNRRRAWARLGAWLRPRRADAEMEREMAAHLALIAEEHERRGMTPQAARRAARLAFGSGEAARERHREARSLAGFDQIGRDLRLAFRSLRHAPAFSVAALLTLVIALGATLAIFAVVNSVLLEPLPYPNPSGLVELRQFAPGAGGISAVADGLLLSQSMYVTYAEYNHSFSAMGIWSPDNVNVSGQGRAQQVPAINLSNGVLEALEVPPFAGRSLGAADFVPNGQRTVLLSYGFWRQQFGGSKDAIGRTMMVDNLARTIVGVMPPGFRIADQRADLLIPEAIPHTGLTLAGFGNHGLARLKPGVTLASADRDLHSLLEVWMNSWTNCTKCDPHFYRTWRITPAIEPLKQAVTGDIGGVLWVLMAGVLLVMVIAAGNVINLFLVRAEARQHELAVRAALGAGRGRIARSLLLEALLLALGGAAGGLALAAAALRWLQAAAPAELPRLNEIALEPRVVVAGLGLALAAAIAAGLIPAWRAVPAPAQLLAGDGRTSTASRQRQRVRRALSITQVALALMLLVAAGLLWRTVAALRAVHPGVSDPSAVETFHVSIPPALISDDMQIARAENNITDRVAAIPGVRAAGFANQMPMESSGEDWDIVAVRGHTLEQSPPVRLFLFISPGYVRAAGTRLLAGRDFTWTDMYGLRPVVLVSRNYADDYWGNPQAALGHEVSASGPGNWRRIVGVVEDVHQDGVAKSAPVTVYWPALEGNLWNRRTFSVNSVTFAVHTDRAGTAGLHARILQAVADVNPNLPVADYRTLAEIEHSSMALEALTMLLLSLAAAMALTLGLVGLYGVVAYDVARRRREIGIRLVLGASPGSVVGLLLGQALVVALVGCGLGLVAAAALAPALHALLYGTAALDPLTFAAAPLVLLAAVALACYLPARRAAAQPAADVLRD
ncbi:MAG: ADOP family duplicated permease [Terriglobales bacterium]